MAGSNRGVSRSALACRFTHCRGQYLRIRNSRLAPGVRMITLFTFLAPPDRCGYLPEQTWQLRYEIVGELSDHEYSERLLQGWRRFGHSLFRPECPSCRACLPLRVDTERFQMSRTQKRVWKKNVDSIRLEIHSPTVTREKLALYDRFHAHQSRTKGWPEHAGNSADSYHDSFVNNPIGTQEWCYYLGKQLVGVGFVDHLPIGLSAIYFYHEPDLRERSLGVFNVLTVMAMAKTWRKPHVYLGFYVEECASLVYKAKYRPNEVLDPRSKKWIPFRDHADRE